MKNVNRWFLLIVLFLGFTSTFVMRFIWAPLLPTVSAEFGMSGAESGMFMTIWYIGYLTTQLPSGILADRFGVKALLAVALIIGGVSTFCLSFIDGYLPGLVLRFIGGVGGGCIASSCTRVITDKFEMKQRGTAFGVFYAAHVAGIFTSNTIGPWTLAEFSWHAAWQIAGTAAVIIGIVIFIIVPKEPRRLSTEGVLDGIKLLGKSTGILLMAVVGFAVMWMTVSFQTWANTYMGTIGIENPGSVMQFYAITGLVGAIGAGLVADKFKLDRRWFMIVTFALMIITCLLFFNNSDVFILTIIAAAYGCVSYFQQGQTPAMITHYATDKYAAQGMGGCNTVWQLAGVISPAVMGIAYDTMGNFTAMGIMLCLGPIVGIIACIALRWSKRIGDTEPSVPGYN